MIPLSQLVLCSILVMRLPYRCTVLRSLKTVNFDSTWYNRAFSKSVCAIHLIGAELSHSVPMHASSIVLQMAGDCDLKLITPVGLDRLLPCEPHVTKIRNFGHTGPGYWPLKTDIGRSNPSGAIVTFVISRWYCRYQHKQLKTLSIISATYSPDYASDRPFQIHISIDVVVVLPAGPRCRSMVAACGTTVVPLCNTLCRRARV